MAVDVCYIMPMLDSMTLTTMQGHSGSTKANNQRWIISTTTQAISINTSCNGSQYLRDLDYENGYMAWPSRCWCRCLYPVPRLTKTWKSRSGRPGIMKAKDQEKTTRRTWPTDKSRSHHSHVTLLSWQCANRCFIYNVNHPSGQSPFNFTFKILSV